MKTIQTQIRHLLTFLAGLGTYLLSLGLLTPDAADKVNALGADVVEPLALLFGAIIAGLFRWAMAWLGKQFPFLAGVLGAIDFSKGGTSENGGASGGGGSGGSVLLLALLFAGVVCLLPSCAGSAYPLTGSISYRDPNTGAKGGLIFEPGQVPRASVRVPVYDESGRLIGVGELSGPLAREITATK